ncbi:N-acetyltransferase [bacterium]|nr:N-acetyltransferase [bacterium]
MVGCESLNILDIIADVGPQQCQAVLETFECPLNLDVERFAKEQAVDFACKHLAITYLVVAKEGLQSCLLGYYALTMKFVNVKLDILSNSLCKKISKFAQFNQDTQEYMLAMPLIAQLGKNYNPALPICISGSKILELALDTVNHVERLIGGKTVYIECAQQPKLHDFYSQAGFVEFGHRPSLTTQEELVQMFKYL